MNPVYVIIGTLIICLPLIFLTISCKCNEAFAASQGGAQVQLKAGKVYSEEEMSELLKYQKHAVVRDIVSLTEPESKGGPYPANQMIKF